MVGCGAVYEKDTDKTEDFCASDYQRCNGACVSLMSDSHCGKCGEACGDNASCFKDDQGNYACQCATGYATCASDECAIDVTTDISHCGGCFNKCGQDEECVGGECVCNSLTRENKVLASDADRAQAYASELANCGQCGYDCKAVSVDNDRCVEGHCRCAGDGTSCVEGDGCSVDLNSDPKNCGQCGHECEAAANCIDGKCGCATGQVYCDGECVDNNDEHCGDGCLKCLDNTECNVKTNACLCSDPDAFIKRKACLIGDNIYGCVKLGTDQNCADCGNICMGGTTCQSGQCKCREGYALCGSKNCLNIQTDPLHCGECHNACQKSTPHCVAGQCRPCAANQIDCGNGKCVPDTLTGNAICMACGIGHHIDTKTGKIVEGCGFGQECHWNSKVGKYACFCDNHACQPYSLGCRPRESDVGGGLHRVHVKF